MRGLRAVVDTLSALNDRLLWVCRHSVIALVGAIVVIVSLGVFFRFVLNNSLPWTEEVAKFVMVWMAFVGSPIVLRQGGHIAIDFVPNLLPRVLQQLLVLVVHAAVMTVLAVLVIQGWALAVNALPQVATTVPVSLFYIFLAVPIGCAIMLTVSLEQLLRTLGNMFAGSAPADPSADGGPGASGFA